MLCDAFHTTMTDLSIRNRDCMFNKASNISVRPFTGKQKSTLDIEKNKIKAKIWLFERMNTLTTS